MKKTIAVVLVLALALFAVSAKQSNEIYAGGKLGLNFASNKMTDSETVLSVTTTTTAKASATQLQFAAEGEYYFTENMGVGASFALDFPLTGETSATVTINGNSTSSEPVELDDLDLDVSFGVDFAYKYAVNKDVVVVGKAGFANYAFKRENAQASSKLSGLALRLTAEGRYAMDDVAEGFYIGGGVSYQLALTKKMTATVGDYSETTDADKLSATAFAPYFCAGMKF